MHVGGSPRYDGSVNRGFEPGELDVAIVDHTAELVDEASVVRARPTHDLEATCARPGIVPAGRRSNHRHDAHRPSLGLSLEVVQGWFVPMVPRRREHLVEEPPAQPDATVRLAVLVEREQGHRVGLEPALELCDLTPGEVCCLRGSGLCLWRIGRLSEAEAVFARVLALNPVDNQGARFCWADVCQGRTWDEAVGPGRS